MVLTSVPAAARGGAKRARKRLPPLPPPPSYHGPTRITPTEACAILACSETSLYRMAKALMIPAHRIGMRGWGFYREPLVLWKQQQLAHGLEATP